jgi:hypothetical protein
VRAVRHQPPDLPVAHVEYIAKDQVQKSAILFGGAHGTLRHDDIAFFYQPADGDPRLAGKSVIDDVLREVVLASDMKCTRKDPLDVVRKAGQDLRTIRLPETLHVGFNRPLVRCHLGLLRGWASRFDHEEYRGALADVENFVPSDAFAREVAAGREVHLAHSVRVGNPHPAPGKHVAEMAPMEVTLVPDRGRERATKDPLLRILMQHFAHGLALPTRFERVRKRQG